MYVVQAKVWAKMAFSLAELASNQSLHHKITLSLNNTDCHFHCFFNLHLSNPRTRAIHLQTFAVAAMSWIYVAHLCNEISTTVIYLREEINNYGSSANAKDDDRDHNEIGFGFKHLF